MIMLAYICCFLYTKQFIDQLLLHPNQDSEFRPMYFIFLYYVLNIFICNNMHYYWCSFFNAPYLPLWEISAQLQYSPVHLPSCYTPLNSSSLHESHALHTRLNILMLQKSHTQRNNKCASVGSLQHLSAPQSVSPDWLLTAPAAQESTHKVVPACGSKAV